MILAEIQKKLKAPKKQFNTFGNFHYRSCEDILEAVKPLLPDNCYIIITDEIVCIEGRHYVRAMAILYEGGKILASASALAREAAEKKGMDEAQITGSASSYARKFALSGLLMIDDTADADTADNTEETAGKKLNAKVEKESEQPALLTCEQLVEKMETAANAFELKNRKIKYTKDYEALTGEEKVRVQMAADKRKGELAIK